MLPLKESSHEMRRALQVAERICQSRGWACGGSSLCYRSPVFCQRCWLPIFNINSHMFVYAMWNVWKLMRSQVIKIIFISFTHFHTCMRHAHTLTDNRYVYLSVTSHIVTQGDRISMIIWFYLCNMNLKSIISAVLGFLCKT